MICVYKEPEGTIQFYLIIDLLFVRFRVKKYEKYNSTKKIIDSNTDGNPEGIIYMID
jgi:hypothetical protein